MCSTVKPLLQVSSLLPRIYGFIYSREVTLSTVVSRISSALLVTVKTQCNSFYFFFLNQLQKLLFPTFLFPAGEQPDLCCNAELSFAQRTHLFLNYPPEAFPAFHLPLSPCSFFCSLCLIDSLTARSAVLHLPGVIHHSSLSTSVSTRLSSASCHLSPTNFSIKTSDSKPRNDAAAVRRSPFWEKSHYSHRGWVC